MPNSPWPAYVRGKSSCRCNISLSKAILPQRATWRGPAQLIAPPLRDQPAALVGHSHEHRFQCCSAATGDHERVTAPLRWPAETRFVVAATSPVSTKPAMVASVEPCANSSSLVQPPAEPASSSRAGRQLGMILSLRHGGELASPVPERYCTSWARSRVYSASLIDPACLSRPSFSISSAALKPTTFLSSSRAC